MKGELNPVGRVINDQSENFLQISNTCQFHTLHHEIFLHTYILFILSNTNK